MKRPGNPPSADLMRFETDQVFPVKTDRSLIRAIDARDDIEEGCLSSSIGSDEPDNLSFIYVKGDIGKDGQASEVFGYIYQLKRNGMITSRL